jgi:hypothetical protein
MMIFNPQMQLPEEVKQFTISVIKSYYKMADDLVRSFEKIDVEQYLPELPDIIKQAYGQGGDQFQQFMKQIGGMIGEQGGSPTGMEGLNNIAGMGASSGGAEGTVQ